MIKFGINVFKGLYKLHILYSFICIISSLLGLVIPLSNGLFINYLILQPELNGVILYAIILFSINAIITILNYCSSRLAIKLQVKASFDLNKSLIESIHRKDYLYFKNLDLTYMNQRINTDSNVIVLFFLNIYKDLFVNILILFFTLSLLFYVSSYTVLLFLFLTISYLFLYLKFNKKLLDVKRKVLEINGFYFSELYSYLANTKIIKFYNKKLNLTKKLLKKINEVEFINLYSNKIQFYISSIEKVITLINQIIILIYGAILVIDNKLSIGLFTTLTTYYGYTINSLKYFSNLYQQLVAVKTSYNRICEIDVNKIENNKDIIVNDIESIEFKNVNFNFKKGHTIIDKFSSKFEKGYIYHIDGLNGSGKSTLVNLMTGLYKNFEGEILINKMDIRNLDTDHLRENSFGLVDQSPLLFDGTIKENILIDQYSLEKLLETLKLFKLLSNEDFLNKNINEYTNNVSGGEGQKINIVRELIREKRVLIFDEPSSNLDIESKNNLLLLLNNIKKNHIVILISHDKEFSELSDITISLKPINK